MDNNCSAEKKLNQIDKFFEDLPMEDFQKGDIVFTQDDRVVKVEKGNKPTDWSPAPEDIDSIRILDNMYNRKEQK